MIQPKKTVLWENKEKKQIRICAWCEDPEYTKKHPFTDSLRAEGYIVNRGMCKACGKRQWKEYEKGE